MNNKLREIETSLLMTFVTLYEEKSVTNAATLLKVAQSNVSRHLKVLRELTGDQLFNYESTDRRMVPSLFADRAYPEIKAALEKIERTLLSDEDDLIPRDFTFKLGLIESCKNLQGEITGALELEARNLVLESHRIPERLEQDAFTSIKKALTSGGIHALIHWDDRFYDNSDIDAMELFTIPYCLISKKPRGEMPKKSLGFNDLKVLEFADANPEPIDRYFQRKQEPRKLKVITDSHFDTALNINRSSYYGFVPYNLANEITTLYPELMVNELDVDLPPMRVSMFWSKSEQLTPRLRWFRNVIRRSA